MLFYASHPILGYENEPPWIQDADRLVAEQGHVLYRPRLTFQEHMDNPRFAEAMKRTPLSTSIEGLEIPDSVLGSVERYGDDFERDDLNALIVFRDLFVLVRSQAILIDGNNTSHGGTPMETLFAAQMHIPSALICDRTVPSPWLRTFTDVLCSTEMLPSVINMLLKMQEPEPVPVPKAKPRKRKASIPSDK